MFDIGTKRHVSRSYQCRLGIRQWHWTRFRRRLHPASIVEMELVDQLSFGSDLKKIDGLGVITI
ncbi:hypothetical protein PENANT_c002G04038 [Penicillium antarcticum]|uniref:Uncharacterized protein n=1 Tax=Penicillium antarcticum TaxID=416450 RepID=A0A1V6QJU8_9EURO|nr:hypothetical protein PENANT_c002G04038 [Penicillium antarcticum]